MTNQELMERYAKGERNFRRADLSEADLSGANLTGANLSWADLTGTDLSKANLSKADLSKADLSWADLSKANLSKADLYGAVLCDANLDGARITYRGETVTVRYEELEANADDHSCLAAISDLREILEARQKENHHKAQQIVAMRQQIAAIKQCQKEAFFDGFYAGCDADLVDAKRCWAKFQARREATS